MFAYLISAICFIVAVFFVFHLEIGGAALYLSACCMFWMLGTLSDQIDQVQRDLTLMHKEPPVRLEMQLQDLRLEIKRLERVLKNEPEPPPPPPKHAPPSGPWTCSRCGEKCEEQFTSCWQCKTARV